MAFLGLDAKLYYEDGGYTPDAGAGNKADISGGVGTLVNLVQDVTLNLEKADADVTTRGNNGFRARVGTLKDGGVEFQMLWDPSNAVFSDLFSAWYSNTKVGFAILDEAYAAATAGTGLIGDFDILNFTRTEALEEALVAQVSISLTDSTVVPGILYEGAFL